VALPSRKHHPNQEPTPPLRDPEGGFRCPRPEVGVARSKHPSNIGTGVGCIPPISEPPQNTVSVESPKEVPETSGPPEGKGSMAKFRGKSLHNLLPEVPESPTIQRVEGFLEALPDFEPSFEEPEEIEHALEGQGLPHAERAGHLDGVINGLNAGKPEPALPDQGDGGGGVPGDGSGFAEAIGLPNTIGYAIKRTNPPRCSAGSRPGFCGVPALVRHAGPQRKPEQKLAVALKLGVKLPKPKAKKGRLAKLRSQISGGLRRAPLSLRPRLTTSLSSDGPQLRTIDTVVVPDGALLLPAEHLLVIAARPPPEEPATASGCLNLVTKAGQNSDLTGNNPAMGESLKGANAGEGGK
jgi:hypothetical protein